MRLNEKEIDQRILAVAVGKGDGEKQLTGEKRAQRGDVIRATEGCP